MAKSAQRTPAAVQDTRKISDFDHMRAAQKSWPPGSAFANVSA
jgi:hypothetical protein